MPELCNICIVTITVEPTCLIDGVETRTCTKHKLHEESWYIDPLGHDLELIDVITAALCTTTGFGGYVCTRNECNHSDTTAILELGHSLSDWSVITAATCITTGLEGYVCMRTSCIHTDTTSIPELGHDSSWILTTPPDFAAGTDGIESCICSRCGTIDSRTYFIYAIGDTGPGGGIIFYVADGLAGRPLGLTVQGYTEGSGSTGNLNFDSYTAYYLEAAPSNIGSRMWAENADDLIPGLSQIANDETDWVIGRGRLNTSIIIAHGINQSYTTPAASACFALTTGGKTDWFLPSRNEIYTLALLRGQFGFPDTGYHHTSSQNNAATSRDQNFAAGLNATIIEKNYPLSVRAIRAF